MAHFAKVEDGVVTGVFVISNDEIVDSNGVEQESLGIARCNELMGELTGEANWIQTSYNNNFRKNYASKGYTYDQSRDAFIPPQPYPSWLLNEDTCLWDAPVAHPNKNATEENPGDGKLYKWDEDTTNWVEVNNVNN